MAPIQPRVPPPRKKRDIGAVLPSRKMEHFILPPEPKASEEPVVPADPDEVPLPQGRTLGEVGLKIWSKLTKLLKERKNLKEDYLEALYTLCSLEQTAYELREAFTNNLTIESKFGNVNVNGAVGYWSKVVDQLKAYYMEFNLTPRSATKEATEQAKISNPDANKPLPVESLRSHQKEPKEGSLFDPI